MANKRTANAKPDYDAIRKKMVYVFTIMGIPAQDVEDLVQEVCEKVIECWDPEKEKHWDKPGEALAYIISYKVAARYFERIRRMPPTPLANIDESELAKSKIEPNPQDEAVLEDELRLVTQWIDEWFQQLTPWKQIIWELRFVYDLDVITIGFLIRGERNLTHKEMDALKATHHGAGYREITPIFESFVEYLGPKIAKHLNW